MRVTVAHVRSVPGFSARGGFCLSGARAWFERHGLNWREFVREGIAPETLEATRDPMAIALVAHARSLGEVPHGR